MLTSFQQAADRFGLASLELVNPFSVRKELSMFAALKSLIRDDEGATMVEYGLLIALIAMVALVAVKALGTSVSTLFNTVAGSV
jgi:pilus assembly protein Flp/PilA